MLVEPLVHLKLVPLVPVLVPVLAPLAQLIINFKVEQLNFN